jgi:hypothetical protein
LGLSLANYQFMAQLLVLAVAARSGCNDVTLAENLRMGFLRNTPGILHQNVALSLAKMPSGLNAFEISDIQEEQTDAGQPGR